ncbi:MAG: GHKL domain-containing protein [Bacteroidales bacterium]|nr:GHKL domain-containing protein [Bacteroidales bacterium]
MSKKHRRIWLVAASVLVVSSAVLFFVSLFMGIGKSDTAVAATDLGLRVEKRMQTLDGYIREALEGNPEEWMQLKGLPEDMVVYRYVNDSLQSWANQFPIRSDDIRQRTLVQRLGDTRGDSTSPLEEVTDYLTYINLGPKWYLVKSARENDMTVIAGLEIVNELQEGSIYGVNTHLLANSQYSIKPLESSVGSPVLMDGHPLFKLTAETISEPALPHSVLLWLAIGLLLTGLTILLSLFPAFPFLGFTVLVQLGVLGWMFFYGQHLAQESQLFSPLLYADGQFLYSLGAVVIVNLFLTLLVLDLYFVRWKLLRSVSRRSRGWQAVAAVLAFLSVAAIVLYLHFTFRSIGINSDICLELYKVNQIDLYTGIVYASFLFLSLTVPLLLQMASPLMRSLAGFRYNMFSGRSRVLYAAVTGIYFVTASSTLGLRKEQLRVDVWANRLAMDRDIALEIQLRSVENAIAEDQMVGVLSVLENSTDLIRGRLVSAYMGRIAQDYDISVVPAVNRLAADQLFTDRIRGGVRLSDNSHFFYSSLGSGRVSYTGLFSYYVPNFGSSTLLIMVESKHNREDRGYLSLLGISDPGRITLPPAYSSAKYVDERLVQYKGAYPYPTLFSGDLKRKTESRSGSHVDMDGWCHFVHSVSEGEVVILSRPSIRITDYVVEGFLLAILAFFAITLLTWRRRTTGDRRYYQTRISLVIYISLTLTLIAMAVFSVWFVYKRNDADMQSIMTSRINTLQAMLQEHLRQVEAEDIRTAGVLDAVEGVGNNLRSDITLFDPEGRMALSTTPEVYDRMILGHRLDDDAYYNIVYLHKRFYMHRERANRRSYYALYAPVFNSAGEMVAIVSSPFTDITTDLESESISHIATILTLFLLLLMLSRLITYEVIGRMFHPLREMSRKMTVTDIDHLEPIVYDQDDELTGLVNAYNRMVQDLGESTRRLTQVDRDKAWTDMARRVAHDLKNPLTPIKLQLQMLIRMKSSGNPAWQERFDEVASTVLFHVDLLADSADQFSTFAKMYDQKMEPLDLDSLVRQEVDLFDSRDDVRLDYYGLEGAMVTAQRPQLTRVVVNLITNAIQAVDGNPGEKRILIALRNSAEEGFYDIVVEDNGPGVEEQNQDKIFTPDFTTKTSGSGLGLAICRRIVEHCGGTISYSRSFTLGGACFTVRYPKG